MTTKYSISRLGCFETCKLQFKYRYIDKIKTDLDTIEAFLGTTVHETLEDLYKDVFLGKTPDKDWLLDTYRSYWNKNYHDDVQVIKDGVTADNYFTIGEQCLNDYYDRFIPFNKTKVIATERGMNLTISYNGNEYAFYGILDRIDWNDTENIFEIHDYKTSSKLMTQEEADTDLQLAVYHLALLKNWPDAEKVKLVWHYLRFNKDVTSFRTLDQLDNLQKTIGEKIEIVESCTEFPPNESTLCKWCGYRDICPLHKHAAKIEKLPENEYLNEPGVKLVAEYKKLEEEKRSHKEHIKQIEEEQEKIKEAAIAYAEKEDIKIIDGPDIRMKIDVKTEYKVPTKSNDPETNEALKQELINLGLLEEVGTISGPTLNARLRAKTWPQETVDRIMPYLEESVNKVVKLVKKK